MSQTNIYIDVSTMKQAPQLLVINSGSSSLKATLFLLIEEQLSRALDAHFKFEDKQSSLTIASHKGTSSYSFREIKGIHSALTLTLDYIFSSKSLGFALDEVFAVGHRVVHGGKKNTSSMLVTPDLLQDLKANAYLAPLHNPACIEGILRAQSYFSAKTPQIAVFDTAFHSPIPSHASTYAIPHTLSEKHSIKRYGFHGIAHEYLSKMYHQQLSKQIKNSKIITLHLGSGCSAAAINEGASVDTSMGFTPLEGLIMSTRCGDIDPGLVEFLCSQECKSTAEITEILNKESGLLGCSGVSSDMKILLENSGTNPACDLAIKMFAYRIVKYVGAYMAVLKGLNAILFSGGIGENAAAIRKMVLEDLKWCGVKLDKDKNAAALQPLPGEIFEISKENSKIKAYVIGVDESAFIANEVLLIIPKMFQKLAFGQRKSSRG